jgi:hypothetical protein
MISSKNVAIGTSACCNNLIRYHLDISIDETDKRLINGYLPLRNNALLPTEDPQAHALGGLKPPKLKISPKRVAAHSFRGLMS